MKRGGGISAATRTGILPDSGDAEDSMVYLHEFTTFIINVMPEDERERAGDYIGHILALVFVPDVHFDVDERDIHRTIL